MPKRRSKHQVTKTKSLAAALPTMQMETGPESLRLVHRSIRGSHGIGIGFFATIWMFGLLKIFGELIPTDPSPANIFGVLLFSSVALFIWCLVILCFLHCETLRLDSTGLEWRLYFLLPVRRQKIPWSDLVAIHPGLGNGVENHLIRGWGLEIETKIKTFSVLLDIIDDEERASIQKILQQFVADIRIKHDFSLPLENETKTSRRAALQLIETPQTLEISGVPELNWKERCLWLVWFLGWTTGCIALSYAFFFAQHDKPQGPLAFRIIVALLFWSPWLFVTCSMLTKHFRWESLRLDSEGLHYQKKILIPFLFRYVTFQDNKLAFADIYFADLFY